MSRGRPKKNITTKRIQAVLPVEILEKLDKKVSGDKNLDRSKALTEAVNQWLGLTKKKRSFENIYKKFFGYRGVSEGELYLGLKFFGNYESQEEPEEKEKEIIGLITEKLFENKALTSEEEKEINSYFSNLKISVDHKLGLHFESKYLLELLGKLYLNSVFPINNYIGRCKYCGKEFFKRKLTQKYDTPICKKYYLEKMKIKTNDPKKIIKINKDIEKLRQSNESINEFFNSKNKDTFENVKRFIENLCFKANYNYSEFKKLIKQFLDDEYRLKDIGNLFYIYISHIIQTYDITTIENLEYNDFGDFFIRDVFPRNDNIRLTASKEIKDLISQDYFEKRKAFILMTYHIRDLPIDCRLDVWKNFANKDVSDLIKLNAFKNPEISDELKKDLLNVGNLLKAYTCTFGYTMKSIEICEKMIKEDENNIEAIQLLIDIYFTHKEYKKVISYYKKMKEVEKRKNMILATNNSPFTTILPTLPYIEFLKPRHLEAITAVSATLEGNYEMSMNLLNGETIKKLKKLKESGEKVLERDLYYIDGIDIYYVKFARTLNKFYLSNDEGLIKEANEIKDAYLSNNDMLSVFKELNVVTKYNPEFEENIYK